MTLAERIEAQQCRVVGCQRKRHPDSAVCADCLPLLWRNQLDRNPDGTYSRRRVFVARDETWRTAA